MSKRKSKVNSDTGSATASSSSESSSDDEQPKKKKKKKKTSQQSSDGGTPRPAEGDVTISQTKFQMIEMIK